LFGPRSSEETRCVARTVNTRLRDSSVDALPGENPTRFEAVPGRRVGATDPVRRVGISQATDPFETEVRQVGALAVAAGSSRPDSM
jgi:hypothetical protein